MARRGAGASPTYIRTYVHTVKSQLLAECVALWGEPEQAVHGTKERREAVSSGMKLVIAMTCATQGGGGCARGVHSHSSDLRCLSSSLRSFSGRFLLCPGLTQPVLCCFNSVPGALSHSILRFFLRLLRCLRGSLREHDCSISTIDPRSFTLYSSVFSNFHNATIVIQRIQNLRYDVRILTYAHTYIHTYIQTF